MMPFNALKLAFRTASFKIRGRNSDPANDYNKAAATYDIYYSRHLGPSAQVLLDMLPLRSDTELLDLACGTGYFSHQLARAIGPTGRLTSVDISAGMLACNRRGAESQGLTNIQFVEGDAMDVLRSRPPSSVDGVVCGWGICYMDHAAFRNEVERVLRPGGFLGIIENRDSSLKRVSDLFRKALVANPEAMVKNISINLPRDAAYLVKTLCRGALTEVSSWNGEVLVPCRNGAEVAEYLAKSGASAGFNDALDERLADKVIGDFAVAVDRERREGRDVQVNHEYCALIAKRN